MDRPADGRFGEVANEENAAAVKLRQAAEAIEANLPETVPGIEDHEVGLGFLERVIERVMEHVLGSPRAESGEDMERTETALRRTTRRAASPWRSAKRG